MSTTKLNQTLFTSKKGEEFSFYYPLKSTHTINGKKTEQVDAMLKIEGIGKVNTAFSRLDVNNRYDIEIEFVFFNHTDIRPVLEHIGGMGELYEAAAKYFASLEDKLVRA